MDQKKRIGVFVFYDKDGIVDDYVIYLLRDLSQVLDRLVIVCNGKLSSDGRDKLETVSSDVFVRKNIGYDAGAYKEAFEKYIGWEELRKYDELVMCNDTFYGPFWPFQTVFDEMEKQSKLDFWGLTVHGKTRGAYGELPEHLQSFFLTIRHRLLHATEFVNFWEEVELSEEDVDSIIKGFEANFTYFFENCGFRWAAYADTRKTEIRKDAYSLNHTIYNCEELISKYRCPIIKRRAFTWKNLQATTDGGNTARAMLYIENKTEYDTTLIYKHLLRIGNITLLKRNLRWDYILSTQESRTDCEIKDGSTLVVMHVYYPELMDECLAYIRNVPAGIDVLITTSNYEIVEELKEKFSNIQANFLGVLKAPRRGRDIAAFLIAAREKMLSYRYVCFTHDKKMSADAHYYTLGENFRELILKNVLASENYIRNIITLFEENPCLGVLAPPSPFMGAYLNALGHSWAVNLDATKELAERLNLNCDLDRRYEPYVLGTSLWFRVEALRPLLEYPFKITDLPEEPLPPDGTISHAVERIFPYVAQSQGYYSGWVMTEKYASLYVEQFGYMVSDIVKTWVNSFSTVWGFEDLSTKYRALVESGCGRNDNKEVKNAWGAKEAFFSWDEDLLRAAMLAERQEEIGLETIGFASAWSIFRISLDVWRKKHSLSKLRRQQGEFMARQKMPSVKQTWWLVRKTFGIWVKKKLRMNK